MRSEDTEECPVSMQDDITVRLVQELYQLRPQEMYELQTDQENIATLGGDDVGVGRRYCQRDVEV